MNNQKILLLGGTGSLGQALTERYLVSNSVFIYSRGENAQWEMKQKYPNHKIKFYIGDIRDKERLKNVIWDCKPDIIIHASALKHIDICEENPSECIETNVNGTKNLLDIISAPEFDFIKTVLFVSTDKACLPVNIYGMSKGISERLVIEKSRNVKTKLVCVRYGNVLTSRGSIIPFFQRISKQGDFFPVTDIRMTRFLMTLEESVNLIEYAILKAETGDTVVSRKIKSFSINDIAILFSLKYNKPIIYSGIRPGEKLHETLISSTESTRTFTVGDYYVIKPIFSKVFNNQIFEFNSSEVSKDLESLKVYLN